MEFTRLGMNGVVYSIPPLSINGINTDIKNVKISTGLLNQSYVILQ